MQFKSTGNIFLNVKLLTLGENNSIIKLSELAIIICVQKVSTHDMHLALKPIKYWIIKMFIKKGPGDAINQHLSKIFIT